MSINIWGKRMIQIDQRAKLKTSTAMVFGAGRRLFLISIFVALGMADSLPAQPQESDAPDSGVRFIAADVHASVQPSDRLRMSVTPPGRFEIRSASMLDLIQIAYGTTADRVLGGPGWLAADRFDIVAAASPATSVDSEYRMLRSLLSERFGLNVHNESRPLPAFSLSVTKLKAGVRPAPESATGTCRQGGGDVTYLAYSCQGLTMARFAEVLPEIATSYVSGKPVMDKSGLEGAWTFSLSFTPMAQAGTMGSDAITLFDALEKQLGLHLVATTVSGSVLVVDKVSQRPADNPEDTMAKLPPPVSAFEFAVIRSSDPSSTGESGFSIKAGGILGISHMNLRQLIAMAWNIRPERMAGPQKTLDGNAFDINARAPADPITGQRALDTEAIKLMMQSLLNDRFRLRTHTEDRLLDAYVLTMSASKLRKADPANRFDCQGSTTTEHGSRTRLLTCRNATMKQLAAALVRVAAGYFSSIPVVDESNPAEAFDFELNFSTASTAQANADLGASGGLTDKGPGNAISIFDALREQLGIRLDLRKRPLPVLVVDQLEAQPTDN
jgi:uncharacterized protein (TIGR03435 family)